ncbi:MAG: cob(I)yrinic acid a,c-diamide adenosyltransferase [Deltaproteobacteria bacterium]|jgi:cob(I)alamin adenosyltransferase|nr:cob(I)yrinic acid a,c-diamide adenosyltransferase [Deltaproteobacteria bacterium]
MAQGLVLINTGCGKGKTTAALGTVLRALGHGHRVVFLQFIKSQATGESRFLESYAAEHPDKLFYSRLGLGFVRDKASEKDLAKASEAMATAEKERDNARLVVLDEINIVLDKGMIPIERVKEFIKTKPTDQSIILTGRNCPKELYDLAHTITEMTDIKHAYREGIKAQRGVDF